MDKRNNKVYQNNIFAPTKHYGSHVDRKRNGIWTGHYQNDKIWYIGNYRHGETVGLFAVYNPQEILQKISFYIR